LYFVMLLIERWLQKQTALHPWKTQSNMKTILNWKKGIFKSTYEIYSENILVGRLKDKSWTQSADGEINGKKYSFKTKGFFKQETQITDSENNTIVGKITYNSWKTRAKIELNDIVIHWKYSNFWNTKWSLYNSENNLVNFQGSSSKGTIEYDENNDLLVLAGLYITNYYWQITLAVIIAVFIPIWITVIT
jgi:hypothetical protein